MIYIKKLLKVVVYVLVVLFIVIQFFEPLQRVYIKIFKTDTFVGKYNLKNQLHGEFIQYKNGEVSGRGEMREGMLDGWLTEYYENGKISSKTHYVRNKAHGKDYEFYESGKLKIVSNYQNGVLYGNSTHYYENGKIEFYQAYNIKGNMFYQLSNKQEGPAKLGTFVSLTMYSYDEQDSIQILEYEKVYKTIKDLYITVADPPGLTPQIEIKINGNNLYGFKIENNTLRLRDVFKEKGKYNIHIVSKLLNDKNVVVDSMTSGTDIYVE